MFSVRLFVYAVLLSVSLTANPAHAKTKNPIANSLGSLAASDLEERFGLCNDAQLNARLNNIGFRLSMLPMFAKEGLSYSLKVLDSYEINAVALPNGDIYLFRGLLQAPGVSNDELMAVVIHEMTHSQKQHGLKQLGLGLALGLLGDKTKQAHNLVQALLSSGYSRKYEKEADANIVPGLLAARADPQAALSFFRRLETLEPKKPDALERLFRTHPPISERCEVVKSAWLKAAFGSDYIAHASGPVLLESGLYSPLSTTDWSDYAGFLATPPKYFDNRYHLGKDIKASEGSSVYAIDKGTIRHQSKGGWGDGNSALIIEHKTNEGESYLAVYGHIRNLTATSGDVSAGQTLGTIGPWIANGKRSDHLHFGIAPGTRIPVKLGLNYLPAGWKKEDPLDTLGFVDPINWITTHHPASWQPGRHKILLEQGPFHMGDDRNKAETAWGKEFTLTPQDLANRKLITVKMRVKGTPRKDPAIFFNRREVGRAVTNTGKWEWFEFTFPVSHLHPGKNLIDLETIIPEFHQSFDDCEVADINLIFEPIPE